MFRICYIDPNFKWVESIENFITNWNSPSETIQHQSSGSTGTPKIIEASKNAMQTSAERTNAFFELTEKSTYLLALPAKFIGGRMLILRAILNNALLYACEPSLNPLLHFPDNLEITFAAFTPAQLYEIIKNPISKAHLINIRKIIIGGAPLSNELQEELKLLNIEVYETYGMTETLSHIALKKTGTESFVPVSKNIKLSVDNQQCLIIEDPELLPNRIIQTNDVVQLNTDGQFIWKGRADFVINSGGLKIHPEELEKELLKIPELSTRNFYLFGQKDPVFGEILVLKVEGFEIADLESKIALKLEKNKCPKQIQFIPKFSRTENGKLKRE